MAGITPLVSGPEGALESRMLHQDLPDSGLDRHFHALSRFVVHVALVQQRLRGFFVVASLVREVFPGLVAVFVQTMQKIFERRVKNFSFPLPQEEPICTRFPCPQSWGRSPTQNASPHPLCTSTSHLEGCPRVRYRRRIQGRTISLVETGSTYFGHSVEALRSLRVLRSIPARFFFIMSNPPLSYRRWLPFFFLFRFLSTMPDIRE